MHRNDSDKTACTHTLRMKTRRRPARSCEETGPSPLPPPIFHRRGGPSLPLLPSDRAHIFSLFSTGRFTSDRSWPGSVALVASTFPAVFTRAKLWEPLSLAAPSAAYVDHLETTPHKKPTPFRKHSSAGRACARQGGPLRACGRVSIKSIVKFAIGY